MNNCTGPVLSYSVHEGKKIVSAVSGLFLKLIYHGAGMVVHLLLLKFSMPVDNLINEASHTVLVGPFLIVLC